MQVQNGRERCVNCVCIELGDVIGETRDGVHDYNSTPVKEYLNVLFEPAGGRFCTPFCETWKYEEESRPGREVEIVKAKCVNLLIEPACPSVLASFLKSACHSRRKQELVLCGDKAKVVNNRNWSGWRNTRGGRRLARAYPLPTTILSCHRVAFCQQLNPCIKFLVGQERVSPFFSLASPGRHILLSFLPK